MPDFYDIQTKVYHTIDLIKKSNYRNAFILLESAERDINKNLLLEYGASINHIKDFPKYDCLNKIIQKLWKILNKKTSAKH